MSLSLKLCVLCSLSVFPGSPLNAILYGKELSACHLVTCIADPTPPQRSPAAARLNFKHRQSALPRPSPSVYGKAINAPRSEQCSQCSHSLQFFSRCPWHCPTHGGVTPSPSDPHIQRHGALVPRPTFISPPCSHAPYVVASGRGKQCLDLSRPSYATPMPR